MGKKVGGYYDDVASAIYLDKTGNILITGNFAGTSDFNPGAATNNLATSSSNNPDIFILKLDTAGNYIWARSLSGASTSDAGLTIASDDQGNVYTGELLGEPLISIRIRNSEYYRNWRYRRIHLEIKCFRCLYMGLQNR
ncbi:MAG: hypothetical protein HWD58_07520 [Bacteroidota bacterium]|nr:MAG: hypothetical protein HWD58_07520 [Bacteroidota bacterium]